VTDDFKLQHTPFVSSQEQDLWRSRRVAAEYNMNLPPFSPVSPFTDHTEMDMSD
jgi:hypothetical protein